MADPKKASPEEIKEALELLERTKAQRAKQRDKVKNNPELKVKQAEASKRRRIKDQILIAKALKAGIQVTDAEVTTAMKA